MRATVRKWGNSASVRIPVAIMQAARLEIDQPVDVKAEGGRIVIEPLLTFDYDLAELVAGITPDNLHEAIEFGSPVGYEFW